METVSEAPEDTVNANPSSVKSDDSSPRAGSGRGSPPPNCAICLGTCKNKSFTDSCLHQFCFSCLLTWSKVKAECPLCKQTFKSIIHNVRSNHQYEEYLVEQRTEEVVERIDIDDIGASTRRFRYRTTLTLPRRQSVAIQQLLLHYPVLGSVFAPPAPRAPPARRRRSPASFRRTVYRHNLWARPLPDFTGRFRDCTPDFYRFNDAQMHRLVPWLNRELHYLLNENVPHVSYVLARILELLPQHHINSAEFRDALQRYFGDRTEHFLHELHCFAATPYDMTGYDRNVQYTTDPRMSTMVNEVISSSDSDSVDSDIVMVSSSAPGPSRPAPSAAVPPPPVYPRHYIPPPASAAASVIPIETISHSDTDDSSSEVMVVGYIKPPADRTPEVVDLLGSDSDVVLNEPQPGPSGATPAPAASTTPLVKLSLKRHVPSDSESEEEGYVPRAGVRPRKRRRSDSSRSWSQSRSAGSSRSWSATISPVPSSHHSSPPPSLSTSSSTTSSSSNSSTHSHTYSDSGSTPSRSERRERKRRKKSKRKSAKTLKTEETTHKSEKEKKKQKKKRKRKGRSPSRATQKQKKSKKKSRSDKEVKRSRRSSEHVPSGGEAAQPGPSGTHRLESRVESRSHEHPRRPSTESKRLKSVVRVMNQQPSETNSNLLNIPNSNLLNILSDAILKPNSNVLAYNSDSGSSEGRTRRNGVPTNILEQAESCFTVGGSRDVSIGTEEPERVEPSLSYKKGGSCKSKRAQGVQTDPPPSEPSDSEDDLPLNLTMRLSRNRE